MTNQQPLTSITDPDELWQKFFDATEDRQPREMLIASLKYIPAPGCALDLGCGCGNDTLAMLKHGLTVTAIDAQDEAIERTLAKARLNKLDDQLQATTCAFEGFHAEPDSYDFIYSGFALPFCTKNHFADFWKMLIASLKPGGIIAGQLFGDRDEWASNPEHPANIFLATNEFDRITTGLDRLHFEDVECHGTTALDHAKHWHVYHFILRKPERDLPCT